MSDEQRTIGIVLGVSRRRITSDDVRRLDPSTWTIEVGDEGELPDLGVAEVFIGNPPQTRCAEIVARMPRLRWFHAAAAGVDRYISSLRERPGVVLTNDRSGARPISEFAMATVFAIAKRLPQQRDAQLRRDWQGGRTGPELEPVIGRRICIIGVGAIGGAIARLARACGLTVVGVRRGTVPHPDFDAVYPTTRIAAAVADADYVVLACPLTTETRGLISAATIAAMPARAWLINLARGEVVDEDALFASLSARRIAGAALDTLWVEPLPASSRWWDLDNVLITPHRAASSVTNRESMLTLLAENLRRYRAGEALLNRVDVARGY